MIYWSFLNLKDKYYISYEIWILQKKGIQFQKINSHKI